MQRDFASAMSIDNSPGPKGGYRNNKKGGLKGGSGGRAPGENF